ncbi:pleckstrin homology domain-containing family G member 4B isoform X3 [Coregonus clupeaformis]|uniref:pleckstrin homology domain-containing family G member 4B isoform X3 n=1 Tax=Coregonus clupeaformis TaxID=59861 RepID=UPI001E1C6975|nr:pleckstrin homology domain-containing family G member 4B isoform X3 [Coregonus clupeaformis]
MLSLDKMHSRAKSRSCDNYLSIKDSESLDSCIQSTLSALYPPFSATASTVLWQLFSVVERQYRGDGLRCLIDFLLPAKRILQSIQQETCVRFHGLLFYHEGWPLCINEKVVLQLAPLHKVRLKQGDFYLQVVPLGRKAAKLVIKCLSASGQAIAEIPIPENMYGSVFTADFLQNVTRERNLHPLQNWLLTTGTVVYRTPWKNVVNPLFVSSTADAIMQARGGSTGFRGQLSACSTSGSTGTLDSHRSSHESLQSQGADSTFSEPAILSRRVHVMDPSSISRRSQHDPNPGLHLMENHNQNHSLRAAPDSHFCSPQTDRLAGEGGGGPVQGQREGEEGQGGTRERTRTLSFNTDLSNPSPRRPRHARDSVSFETRRLFRKSYMEALQNPMNLGSSSESILEEGPENSPACPGLSPLSSREDTSSPAATPGSSPSTPTTTQREQGPRGARLGGARAWLGGDPDSPRLSPSTPLLYLQRGLRNAGGLENRAERRSKSLERTNKVAQVKGHRARSSSGGSASSGVPSPKKLMNGYALRFGRLDLEAAFSSSDSRRSVRDETAIHEGGSSTDPRRHSHDGAQSHHHPPKPSNEVLIQLAPAPGSGSPPNCHLHLPSLVSEVNPELLASGAIILPGNRDLGGRPVLQVCTRGRVWAGESCTAKNLTCLLGYYYSTLRSERQDQGLTVLVDTRRQQPSPALFSSLSELQVLLPNALYSVLLLVDKEATIKPERDITNVQTELVTSLKTLLKHIDSSQLTRDLDGTFPYDHNHWVTFRQKIEPFASSCSVALSSLQSSIAMLSSSSNLDSTKEVSEVLEQQRSLMKCVLEDTSLNRLRLEGGTVLARIRKDEACENHNYRDAVDMVNVLYNQVDEEVHKLVILSNKSLKQLESLLEVRRFEEQTEQIKVWFSVEGAKHITPLDSLHLSLATLKDMRQSLEQFFEESVQQQKQGLLLVRQSGESLPSSALLDFKQHLGSILGGVERRKHQLDILTNLYEFYDSANQWMEHCQDYFRQLNLEDSGVSLPPAVLQILQDYQTEASKFSLDNFSTLSDMVLSLDSPRQTQQWNVLWTKCQQTKNQLEETLAQATAAATAASNSSASKSAASNSAAGNLTTDPSETADRQGGCTHTEQHGAAAEDLVLPELPTLGSRVMVSSLEFEEDTKLHSAGHFSSNSNNNKSPSSSSSCSFTSSSLFPFPPAPEGDPLFKLRQSPSLFDDTDSDCTIDSLGAASCYSEPVYSSSGTPLHHHHQHQHHHQHRKQPLKKIMKKTLSYELTAAQDGGGGHVDTSHLHGYTGVYIKGLEVANNVSVEKKLQRPDVVSPALGRSRSMSSPTRHSEGDGKKHSSKVQHIMDEMISTEREYVRSLSYVIEHYFPEMERLDLPQDLWGKRSIIFGNMEKLCNFHCQYFLKELEASAHSPLSISSCFLRHFGMYALYSKNKPQSDALLTSHGNGFFKNKQLELGDKMDLASYLLKPIQRMSKYALLLKDLIKECGHSQEQELSDLRTAEEMVKFQLRHGNDLLAMDAIRGCDVNLKEQGQLRCQDEFIVWCGRRKYLRHVFLFEDLILFSKTKKIEGGYDLYIYKQSYKTAEIGMTESVGDSGLRFEIWFRRRKSQDTFILQASSGEVKAVWTAIIGKILWRQALRNREVRLKEMVSMGIGSKPFMDIKPSDAAISDRAIDYIMKGSESRTRASIAVSSFDHSTPFKRPHSTISNSSTSSSSSQSSSSLLGSLNLHLYPSPAHQHPHALGSVPSFSHWPYDCIEEDELEQDTGSQPSMITESSGETSSQCISSDSVTGLSSLALPIPGHGRPNIIISTFPSDSTSSFLCSSTPLGSSHPQMAPPPAPFPKDQDLQAQGSIFITASKTSHITIGLSTVV